jgi:hypothetical protein
MKEGPRNMKSVLIHRKPFTLVVLLILATLFTHFSAMAEEEGVSVDATAAANECFASLEFAGVDFGTLLWDDGWPVDEVYFVTVLIEFHSKGGPGDRLCWYSADNTAFVGANGAYELLPKNALTTPSLAELPVGPVDVPVPTGTFATIPLTFRVSTASINQAAPPGIYIATIEFDFVAAP